MHFKSALLFSLAVMLGLTLISPNPIYVLTESSAQEDLNVATHRPRRERDPHAHGRNNREMLHLLREVVGDVNQSILQIRHDEEQIAFGVVVDPRGYVLTKASMLEEGAVCVLEDNSEIAFEQVSVSEEHDLALLKIEASSLTPLVFGEQDSFDRGNWLAAVGLDESPLAVGIIGVSPQRVRKLHQPDSERPYLGIGLAKDDNAAVVRSVSAGSGADEAGLQPGDRIVKIDDVDIVSGVQLIEALANYVINDVVTITLRQEDDSREEIEVTLMNGNRVNIDPHNQVQGGLSHRRGGFPSVFQHDAIVRADECGGPVLNLEGEVVGVNIARSGRIKCYAIPASIINKLLEEWLPAEEK